MEVLLARDKGIFIGGAHRPSRAQAGVSRPPGAPRGSEQGALESERADN